MNERTLFPLCMFLFGPVIYVSASCLFFIHTATLMWVRGRFPFSNVHFSPEHLLQWLLAGDTGRLDCSFLFQFALKTYNLQYM